MCSCANALSGNDAEKGARRRLHCRAASNVERLPHSCERCVDARRLRGVPASRLVRKEGLEPSPSCPDRFLRPARLPIPPLPQEARDRAGHRRRSIAHLPPSGSTCAGACTNAGAILLIWTLQHPGAPSTGRPSASKGTSVAVRRGVWVVVFLLVCAVLASAALVAFSWVAFRAAARRARQGRAGPEARRATSTKSRSTPSTRSSTSRSTLRSLTQALRAAKTDPRVTGVLLRPSRRRRRCGARCRNCATRSSTSGRRASPSSRCSSSPATASTCSRRPHPGRARAAGPAQPDGARQLSGLPARHLRQDWRAARPAAHRRLQDRGQHLHREGLHARAPRDDRVAQPRRVRAAARRGRERAQEVVEEVRALIDQGPMLPDAALAERPGRRRGVLRRDGQDERSRRSLQGTAARAVPHGVPARRAPADAPRVAVLYAVGTIVSGDGGDGPTGHRGRLGQAHRAHPRRSATTTASRPPCCASTARAGRRSPPT